MSAESYKGGEINSQQAEAISTLASANEYKGKSRIITLLELPRGRKWKYFRDQLLARSAAAVAIVCVVIYIAIQVLTPTATPKLYVAVFNDASASKRPQPCNRRSPANSIYQRGARAACSSTPTSPATKTASASCKP